MQEQSRKIAEEIENRLSRTVTGKAAHPHQHSRSYHEMADRPVAERDVLEQLRFNLKQLDESHQRLSFLLREVSSLIR